MNCSRPLILIIFLGFFYNPVYAQEETSPIMIKINRIVFSQANKYTFYIPSFEFHMLFQKDFNEFRSAVSADYDYRRQDMGFGMSHSLSKYIVNPGISVDDNLYFRNVFSDTTGIWRRKQAISPYFIHEISDNSTVGLEFKFEREWSPRRRMGTKIVSTNDRSIKLYYIYQTKRENIWNQKLSFISLERSYKISKGEFNYFIIEALVKYSKEFSEMIRYKSILSFRGNLTPQLSPLFFLGGYSNLIGFENDELWGRQAVNIQNIVEFKPFPDFRIEIKKLQLRRFSILYQIDFGQVKGYGKLEGMRTQNKDIKIGTGLGLGVNTDLPFMPATDVHFIIAAPSTNIRDIKYYAGFGGWIN
ncbi:hypothetical protein ACFL5B_01330 [Candidatus Latescibacterota bacterium]